MVRQVLLEPEQASLFQRLVETARAVPRAQRGEFCVVKDSNSITGDRLEYHGMRASTDVALSDLEVLARNGLIVLRHLDRSMCSFYIPPEGFAYYEQLVTAESEPAGRIEQTIRIHTDSVEFSRRFPGAFARWSDAERQLWGPDSDASATTIGHLCREAMQEFASELLTNSHIPSPTADKARTVQLIRAAIDAAKARTGATEHQFLNALVEIWGAANDLVQRQEHGAQRERDSLTWEDTRRSVFITWFAMYEIDRSLLKPDAG